LNARQRISFRVLTVESVMDVRKRTDAISSDLRRSGDKGATAEAAYSAGETLAALGRATFDRPGWLGPGPAVTAPLLEGKDPMPRFVDLCLGSIDLERRMPAAPCRGIGGGSRECWMSPPYAKL